MSARGLYAEGLRAVEDECEANISDAESNARWCAASRNEKENAAGFRADAKVWRFVLRAVRAELRRELKRGAR